MRRRPPIAGLVLAAFVATTAVPGTGVVAHRHEGGDHEHVHAALVLVGGDHDHRHDHRAHRRARHHPARWPRLARDAHDPLAHVHVVAPFQPATPAVPPTVADARHVEPAPALVLDAPGFAPVARTSSRAPPTLPLA